MERIPVKSSFLTAIGYNAETQVLEIEFRSGRIYQYTDVDPEKHKALVTAESVGTYFSRAINTQHDHRRAVELETKKEDQAPTP